jgi:protein TonB
MGLRPSLSASVVIHATALAAIASLPHAAPVVRPPLEVGFARPAATRPATPAVVVRPATAGARRIVAAQAPSPPSEVSPAVSAGEAVAPRTTSAGAVSAGPAHDLPPRYDAAYLDNPPPEYPAAARRRRIEGTVLIDVAVGSDGRPTAVQLASSSGEELLDRAALAAVRAWRFVPAQRGSDSVAGQVRVPMRFRLAG